MSYIFRACHIYCYLIRGVNMHGGLFIIHMLFSHLIDTIEQVRGVAERCRGCINL